MKALQKDGHASARGAFDNIYMNGQEVFKFAVRAVPTVRGPPTPSLGFYAAGHP
jgi:3-oxoacyl-[acyl-carrier-protein] synthase III